MTKQPLVSIVLPVYNAEPYLEKCLNSLLNQTLYNIEIIAVNDGSRDLSLEILTKYTNKDHRLRIINQDNCGPSTTRNRGMAEAKGEYIGFVDADDWVEKNMFERMYNVANKYNTKIVMCGYKEGNCDSNMRDVLLPFDDEVVLSKQEIKNRLISRMISSDNEKDNNLIFGSVWRCLYSIDLIKDKAILFSEEIRYAEDLIFNLKAFLDTNAISIVRAPLYYYRKNEQSSTQKYIDKFIDMANSTQEEIRQTLYNSGINDDDYQNRLRIRARKYIVGAIVNACRIGNNRSKIDRLNEVSKIINSKEAKDAFNEFDYGILSYKSRIIYPCIKYKFSILLFVYYTSRIN